MDATKKAMKENSADSTIVGNSIRAAAHKIDQYGETLADKSDELIHQGKQTKDKIGTEVEQYKDAVLKYVKENPVQSALIAVGVGFIFGKLFK